MDGYRDTGRVQQPEREGLCVGGMERKRQILDTETSLGQTLVADGSSLAAEAGAPCPLWGHPAGLLAQLFLCHPDHSPQPPQGQRSPERIRHMSPVCQRLVTSAAGAFLQWTRAVTQEFTSTERNPGHQPQLWPCPHGTRTPTELSSIQDIFPCHHPTD